MQNFIDLHSSCNKDESIAELINYQTQKHARNFKKEEKNLFRFNFPLPPMPNTLILEPLEEDEIEKNSNVQQNYTKICEMLNDDSKSCEAISLMNSF